MCSHLNMNTEPIAGLGTWVITLPLHCLLPALIISQSPFLSAPTALATLEIGLWQYYAAFLIISITGQITLSFRTIGLGSLASPTTRGLHKFVFCLFFWPWAVSVQRWDQEMDSIRQQITQPQTSNDCQLSAAHWTDLSKSVGGKLLTAKFRTHRVQIESVTYWKIPSKYNTTFCPLLWGKLCISIRWTNEQYFKYFQV